MMNHTHMDITAIDLDQLFEAQRTATGLYTLKCFLAPERLQFPIGLGETTRQGESWMMGSSGRW